MDFCDFRCYNISASHVFAVLRFKIVISKMTNLHRICLDEAINLWSLVVNPSALMSQQFIRIICGVYMQTHEIQSIKKKKTTDGLNLHEMYACGCYMLYTGDYP